jgi:hypothetical protein
MLTRSDPHPIIAGMAAMIDLPLSGGGMEPRSEGGVKPPDPLTLLP